MGSQTYMTEWLSRAASTLKSLMSISPQCLALCEQSRFFLGVWVLQNENKANTENIARFLTNAKLYGVLLYCLSSTIQSRDIKSHLGFQHDDLHRTISLNLEMWRSKSHFTLHKFGATVTLVGLLYIPLYYDYISVNANTVSVDIISQSKTIFYL